MAEGQRYESLVGCRGRGLSLMHHVVHVRGTGEYGLGAEHGIRFPRSSLTVREDANVVPGERRADELRHTRGREHVLLLDVRGHAAVEIVNPLAIPRRGGTLR